MKREKTVKEKPVAEKEKKEKPPKAKKEKSEEYVLKKNTGMKVLRILLWIILIFVFIRGILSIFTPDKEDVVDRMITDFKENYSSFTSQNEEVMSFAQNFAKEYLTYAAKGEEEYKERLKPYVAASLLGGSLNDFSAAAEAVYVQAYRMEDYSESQKDVFVLADIEYTKRILKEDSTYTEEISRAQLVLKVPVYCGKEGYVVESLPLLVTDSVYLANYKAEDYYGTSLPDAQAAAVQTSIENFLKAYLEQDESVINYYLAASADKESFSGLKGRFTFIKIESIRSYQNERGDIISLVEFKVQDAQNGVKLLQKINLTIQENGGKYYIKAMNTRTGNLNIK